MEHLSNDHEDYPNRQKNTIVIRNAMKWGIPLWIWWEINGKWDNNMIRTFRWRESHCRTNTSIRRKKEIQKSRTVRITVWILVGRLTIWVRSFDIEKLYQNSPDLSGPPEYVSQSLWWTLKSPKTNTLADRLLERTSPMLDEIQSKTVHKDEGGDWLRKK